MTTPHHTPPAKPAAYSSRPMIAAFALVAATTIAAPTIGHAADAPVGMTRTSVPVRGVNLRPASRAAARRLLARLGDAAMAACGADSASLRELRLEARASACWRDAMADAVARIGSPALTAAYGPAPRPIDTATACTKETPCPAPFN